MHDIDILLTPTTTVIQAVGAARRIRQQTDGGEIERCLEVVVSQWESTDALGQGLALHALSKAPDPRMARLLTDCLDSTDGWIQQQAASALSDRVPPRVAIPGLLRLLMKGGAGAMFAQMALVGAPRHEQTDLTKALYRSNETENATPDRARVIETLGLLPSAPADRYFLSLLRDPAEMPAVVAAAARGLSAESVLANLPVFERCSESGEAEIRLAVAEALADVPDERARRSLRNLDCGGRGECPSEFHQVCQFVRYETCAEREGPATTRGKRGLRIVQVHLTGRLDSQLEGIGQGDSGGLATLMVHLGRTLGAQDSVEHVFTLSRSFAGPGIPESYGEAHTSLGPSASIVRIPFGPPRDLPSAELWDYRARIERGLSRALNRLGEVDGAHLRFADVTTFAASRVCAARKIPIFFTLAPDPHAVIRLREQTGMLARRNFAEWDCRESVLFRARLVESLLIQADRLALFPRKHAKADFEALFDIDVDEQTGRIWTVPEGIDTQAMDRAKADLCRTGDEHPAVVLELLERIRDLGEARRGRPLIVSVGRLSHVKGFHRLVEAWASDRDLVNAFNLLILGGSLERPNATEREVLSSLETVTGRYPEARHGLLLLGHRPHRDVARLLAAARYGAAPEVAPRGIYVCASEKEEFGLAILEAMATGLTVVGPSCGGPSTYIKDGENGFLARTTAVPELRQSIHRAAKARVSDVISSRGQRLVRTNFTIGAMAEVLVRMYEGGDRLPASANAA